MPAVGTNLLSIISSEDMNWCAGGAVSLWVFMYPTDHLTDGMLTTDHPGILNAGSRDKSFVHPQ